jgi:hypothetical protein
MASEIERIRSSESPGVDPSPGGRARPPDPADAIAYRQGVAAGAEHYAQAALVGTDHIAPPDLRSLQQEVHSLRYFVSGFASTVDRGFSSMHAMMHALGQGMAGMTLVAAERSPSQVGYAIPAGHLPPPPLLGTPAYEVVTGMHRAMHQASALYQPAGGLGSYGSYGGQLVSYGDPAAYHAAHVHPGSHASSMPAHAQWPASSMGYGGPPALPPPGPPGYPSYPGYQGYLTDPVAATLTTMVGRGTGVGPQQAAAGKAAGKASTRGAAADGPAGKLAGRGSGPPAPAKDPPKVQPATAVTQTMGTQTQGKRAARKAKLLAAHAASQARVAGTPVSTPAPALAPKPPFTEADLAAAKEANERKDAERKARQAQKQLCAVCDEGSRGRGGGDKLMQCKHHGCKVHMHKICAGLEGTAPKIWYCPDHTVDPPAPRPGPGAEGAAAAPPAAPAPEAKDTLEDTGAGVKPTAQDSALAEGGDQV